MDVFTRGAVGKDCPAARPPGISHPRCGQPLRTRGRPPARRTGRRRVRGDPIRPDRWGSSIGISRAKPMGPFPLALQHRGSCPDGGVPGWDDRGQARPQADEATRRSQAIGAHFPGRATDVAAGLAARLAARFQPGFAGDFPPRRDSQASGRSGIRRCRRATATEGNRGSPTSTPRSSRSMRSAGLGSGSTRIATADRPGCPDGQLGKHCCGWENEPGLVGIPYLTGIMGNTSYHTIPSRTAS